MIGKTKLKSSISQSKAKGQLSSPKSIMSIYKKNKKLCLLLKKITRAFSTITKYRIKLVCSSPRRKVLIMFWIIILKDLIRVKLLSIRLRKNLFNTSILLAKEASVKYGKFSIIKPEISMLWRKCSNLCNLYA